MSFELELGKISKHEVLIEKRWEGRGAWRECWIKGSVPEWLLFKDVMEGADEFWKSVEKEY